MTTPKSKHPLLAAPFGAALEHVHSDSKLSLHARHQQAGDGFTLSNYRGTTSRPDPAFAYWGSWLTRGYPTNRRDEIEGVWVRKPGSGGKPGSIGDGSQGEGLRLSGEPWEYHVLIRRPYTNDIPHRGKAECWALGGGLSKVLWGERSYDKEEWDDLGDVDRKVDPGDLDSQIDAPVLSKLTADPSIQQVDPGFVIVSQGFQLNRTLTLKGYALRQRTSDGSESIIWIDSLESSLRKPGGVVLPTNYWFVRMNYLFTWNLGAGKINIRLYLDGRPHGRPNDYGHWDDPDEFSYP